MPGRDGPGIAAGSWPGAVRRRRTLARSSSGPLRPRSGESMRVDDLPAGGLADANVTLHAAIRQAGRRDEEVSFAPRVASGAKVRLLHRAEAEAMLVVVARRAQTTAELARGRVAHEAPALRRGDGEALPAKRLSRGLVQRLLNASGEMLAGQCLLVLRLMAATALAVLDGL